MTMLIYIVPRKLLWKFKGMVQPQMKIVSSITYTHIILNPIRRSFIFKKTLKKLNLFQLKLFCPSVESLLHQKFDASKGS